MPLCPKNESTVSIEPEYDGVVMLSPDALFFNDAQPRPDGRKIFHIFERDFDGCDYGTDIYSDYNAKNFEEKQDGLFSRASKINFQTIQQILSRNGISLEKWLEADPLLVSHERAKSSSPSSSSQTYSQTKYPSAASISRDHILKVKNQSVANAKPSRSILQAQLALLPSSVRVRSIKVDHHKPLDRKEDNRKPLDEMNFHKPLDKKMDHHKPLDEVDPHKPLDKKVNHHKPLEEVDPHKPLDKKVNHHKPLEEVDSHKPLDSFKESPPIKNFKVPTKLKRKQRPRGKPPSSVNNHNGFSKSYPSSFPLKYNVPHVIDSEIILSALMKRKKQQLSVDDQIRKIISQHNFSPDKLSGTPGKGNIAANREDASETLKRVLFQARNKDTLENDDSYSASDNSEVGVCREDENSSSFSKVENIPNDYRSDNHVEKVSEKQQHVNKIAEGNNELSSKCFSNSSNGTHNLPFVNTDKEASSPASSHDGASSEKEQAVCKEGNERALSKWIQSIRNREASSTSQKFIPVKKREATTNASVTQRRKSVSGTPPNAHSLDKKNTPQKNLLNIDNNDHAVCNNNNNYISQNIVQFKPELRCYENGLPSLVYRDHMLTGLQPSVDNFNVQVPFQSTAEEVINRTNYHNILNNMQVPGTSHVYGATCRDPLIQNDAISSENIYNFSSNHSTLKSQVDFASILDPTNLVSVNSISSSVISPPDCYRALESHNSQQNIAVRQNSHIVYNQFKRPEVHSGENYISSSAWQATTAHGGNCVGEILSPQFVVTMPPAHDSSSNLAGFQMSAASSYMKTSEDFGQHHNEYRKLSASTENTESPDTQRNFSSTQMWTGQNQCLGSAATLDRESRNADDSANISKSVMLLSGLECENDEEKKNNNFELTSPVILGTIGNSDSSYLPKNTTSFKIERTEDTFNSSLKNDIESNADTKILYDGHEKFVTDSSIFLRSPSNEIVQKHENQDGVCVSERTSDTENNYYMGKGKVIDAFEKDRMSYRNEVQRSPIERTNIPLELTSGCQEECLHDGSVVEDNELTKKKRYNATEGSIEECNELTNHINVTQDTMKIDSNASRSIEHIDRIQVSTLYDEDGTCKNDCFDPNAYTRQDSESISPGTIREESGLGNEISVCDIQVNDRLEEKSLIIKQECDEDTSSKSYMTHSSIASVPYNGIVKSDDHLADGNMVQHKYPFQDTLLSQSENLFPNNSASQYINHTIGSAMVEPVNHLPDSVVEQPKNHIEALQREYYCLSNSTTKSEIGLSIIGTELREHRLSSIVGSRSENQLSDDTTVQPAYSQSYNTLESSVHFLPDMPVVPSDLYRSENHISPNTVVQPSSTPCTPAISLEQLSSGSMVSQAEDTFVQPKNLASNSMVQPQKSYVNIRQKMKSESFAQNLNEFSNSKNGDPALSGNFEKVLHEVANSLISFCYMNSMKDSTETKSSTSLSSRSEGVDAKSESNEIDCDQSVCMGQTKHGASETQNVEVKIELEDGIEEHGTALKDKLETREDTTNDTVPDIAQTDQEVKTELCDVGEIKTELCDVDDDNMSVDQTCQDSDKEQHVCLEDMFKVEICEGDASTSASADATLNSVEEINPVSSRPKRRRATRFNYFEDFEEETEIMAEEKRKLNVDGENGSEKAGRSEIRDNIIKKKRKRKSKRMTDDCPEIKSEAETERKCGSEGNEESGNNEKKEAELEKTSTIEFKEEREDEILEREELEIIETKEEEYKDGEESYKGERERETKMKKAKWIEENKSEKMEERPSEKVDERPSEKVEERPSEKVEERPSEKMEERPSEKVEERPFKCSECNYCGSTSSLLRRHKMYHLPIKRFQCIECSFSTNFNSYLQEHKVIHSNSRPYKCSYCNFASKLKSNLNKHEKTHTKKMYDVVVNEIDAAYSCSRSGRKRERSVSETRDVGCATSGEMEQENCVTLIKQEDLIPKVEEDKVESCMPEESNCKPEETDTNSEVSGIQLLTAEVVNEAHSFKETKLPADIVKTDDTTNVKTDYEQKKKKRRKTNISKGSHEEEKICRKFELNKDVNVRDEDSSCNSEIVLMNRGEQCSETMVDNVEEIESNAALDLPEAQSDVIKCPTCDFVATSARKMTRHKFVHLESKKFCCFRCEFSCNTKRMLVKHENEKHVGDDIGGVYNMNYSTPATGDREDPEDESTHKPGVEECVTFHCEENSTNVLQSAAINELSEENIELDMKDPTQELSNTCIGTTTKSTEFNSNTRDYTTIEEPLLTNINLVHSGENVLKCSECDYFCRTKFKMKQHQSHHLKLIGRTRLERKLNANEPGADSQGAKEKYICSLCSYTTYNGFMFGKHESWHSTTRSSTQDKPSVADPPRNDVAVPSKNLGSASYLSVATLTESYEDMILKRDPEFDGCDHGNPMDDITTGGNCSEITERNKDILPNLKETQNEKCCLDSSEKWTSEYSNTSVDESTNVPKIARRTTRKRKNRNFTLSPKILRSKLVANAKINNILCSDADKKVSVSCPVEDHVTFDSRKLFLDLGSDLKQLHTTSATMMSNSSDQGLESESHSLSMPKIPDTKISRHAQGNTRRSSREIKVMDNQYELEVSQNYLTGIHIKLSNEGPFDSNREFQSEIHERVVFKDDEGEASEADRMSGDDNIVQHISGQYSDQSISKRKSYTRYQKGIGPDGSEDVGAAKKIVIAPQNEPKAVSQNQISFVNVNGTVVDLLTDECKPEVGPRDSINSHRMISAKDFENGVKSDSGAVKDSDCKRNLVASTNNNATCSNLIIPEDNLIGPEDISNISGSSSNTFGKPSSSMFENSSSSTDGAMIAKGAKKGKLNCTKCNFIGSTKTILQAHWRTHLSPQIGGVGKKVKDSELESLSKAIVFLCQECDKTFSYNSTLRRHMRKKHEGVTINNIKEIDKQVLSKKINLNTAKRKSY